MGKLDSFPERRTAPDPVPGDTAAILLALDAAKAALMEVGADRIELLAATGSGRVSIQPALLADGEIIARELGLDKPLDQCMMDPGYTLWCGTLDDLEFQVRGALRQPLGSVL
ncbi:hypothetical protein ACFT2C_04510 [Promicromonospora sp. NPDC057138]|uniref:hypothetical protein n=1 Tax=Promicromonospora sp. NPDC057138 TaxID=3346031 RepID=UPI0036385160